MSTTQKDIILLPNSHMRERSQRVGLITPDIEKIVNDMQTATLDWEDHRKHEVGVAMAAIQLDKKYRIVVIRSSFKEKDNRTFNVYINPEITKYEGKVEEDFEGCLSVKDIYGRVPRHSRVRVKALNLSGQVVRVSAEGFLARIFQHEIDHTNGMMFLDHIKDNGEAFFKLTKDGKLEPLDYEKQVKNSRILW